MATRRKPRSGRLPGEMAFWAKRDAEQQPYVAPTPKADTVEPRHITIMELGDRTCRWPYGEENFTYCGHQVEGDSPLLPYCPSHTIRATTGAR
jgi:hypothetical protein